MDLNEELKQYILKEAARMAPRTASDECAVVFKTSNNPFPQTPRKRLAC
ncbi:hypothetical protein RAC79_03695 [Agrobacterium sp. LR_9]